jgi:hypothetical protein
MVEDGHVGDYGGDGCTAEGMNYTRVLRGEQAGERRGL